MAWNRPIPSQYIPCCPSLCCSIFILFTWGSTLVFRDSNYLVALCWERTLKGWPWDWRLHFVPEHDLPRHDWLERGAGEACLIPWSKSGWSVLGVPSCLMSRRKDSCTERLLQGVGRCCWDEGWLSLPQLSCLITSCLCFTLVSVLKIQVLFV